MPVGGHRWPGRMAEELSSGGDRKGNDLAKLPQRVRNWVRGKVGFGRDRLL